jgi:hypothetical protein
VEHYVKIAYEKKLPEPEALHQLLGGASDAADPYTRFMQFGSEVVAAYDGDQLIGVGGFGTKKVKATDMEAGAEWAVVIHPSYVRRDIEHTMKKLASW